MIIDFNCKETEKIWQGLNSRKLPAVIQPMAKRKLRMLNNVQQVDELRQPPGNRLEPLKGTRSGQYSIRLNQQYRLCFMFRQGNAYNVEIIDYH